MMKFLKILSIFLICISLINCSDNNESSEYITLGTFNIEWLGDGENDFNPRSENDYKNIAEIIKNTGADILALQEIENSGALNKLQSLLPGYKTHCSKVSGDQNVALIYNEKIKINILGDYMPVAVEPGKTRPGLIIEVKSGSFDFLMMIVHLKSTSGFDSTEVLKQKSREIRIKQAEIISNWIDSVLASGSEKDIIITGDFNDNPDRKTNPTLYMLANNKNIEFLSTGLKSCKFEYLTSIDHICISNSIKPRILSNSIRMYNFFSAYPDNELVQISDHCPVLVTINISQNDND